MKKNLQRGCFIVWICLWALPLQMFGQKVWDNDAVDSQWCNPTNWGLNLDQAENIQPGVNDPANLANRDPSNSVIYVSCDTTVQQIQLRANSLCPRIIQIGTNEVADRTLGVSGSGARLIANQNLGVGRDLIFSGDTNQFGAKLKLRIDVTKPMEVSSNSSSIIVNCEMSGAAGVNKTSPGTMILNASNSYVGPTTVSAGTLLVNGFIDATIAVTNSGGMLGGSGKIGGSVFVTSGGTLAPGASVGTLTIGGDLILQGGLLIELNKALSPSNDMVSVTGTLTNAGTGTVTVTNIGPVLAVGDTFTLFNKPVPNGEALNVTSADGAVWTNNLAVDGSITVLTAPPPSATPATSLSIAVTGPASVNVGGVGAAYRAYGVYAATNVTTPMASWWLLGTTNSSPSGAIQFLDSQATNDQRYYRFGQTLP